MFFKHISFRVFVSWEPINSLQITAFFKGTLYTTIHMMLPDSTNPACCIPWTGETLLNPITSTLFKLSCLTKAKQVGNLSDDLLKLWFLLRQNHIWLLNVPFQSFHNISASIMCNLILVGSFISQNLTQSHYLSTKGMYVSYLKLKALLPDNVN